MKNFCFLAGFLMIPHLAQAKARFAPKTEMIRKSKAIAIVQITRVDPIEKKGGFWTYRQIASANVESVIKGKLPGTIQIYGDENFICAQVQLKVGRFLIFLAEDRDMLVGSNWHLSIRPIENNLVGWYEKEEGIVLVEKSLEEVVKDIKMILNSPK